MVFPETDTHTYNPEVFKRKREGEGLGRERSLGREGKETPIHWLTFQIPSMPEIGSD